MVLKIVIIFIIILFFLLFGLWLARLIEPIAFRIYNCGGDILTIISVGKKPTYKQLNEVSKGKRFLHINCGDKDSADVLEIIIKNKLTKK